MLQPLTVEWVLDLCCAMRHRLHEIRWQTPWVYNLYFGTNHLPKSKFSQRSYCCAMRYRLHDMSLEVPRVCDLAYDKSVHSM